MATDSKQPNWQLVGECVAKNGGRATLKEIEDFLEANGRLRVNARLDAAAISVNDSSRVHYAGGRELRRTDSKNKYDLLFKMPDRSYVTYDPEKHGVWEIFQIDERTRGVRMVNEPTSPDDLLEAEQRPVETAFEASTQFRLESHLRDYLAQNLGLVQGLGTTLSLYQESGQARGVEFQTNVGPIDILAVGANGSYYVIELKLGRGPDAAVGQILRYIAAVRRSLAKDKPVFGVLVASSITDSLRYAVSEVRDRVFVMQYELKVSLGHVVVEP